ncbi:hypothetical protein G6F62_013081 [Rhizopus arrhizus]|nr:hypothetical protein G6F62_013081 [Rhizopus arrhizus]
MTVAVLGDQQQPALEIARCIAGQQLFDAAVEPACALRAFALCGQHAQASGLLQGEYRIGGVGQCAPVAQQVLALATQRVGLAFMETHARQFTAAQQLQCGAAVAFAHGMRQRCQVQCITLPVTALQLHAAPGKSAWCGLRLQRGRRQQAMQGLRIVGTGADAIAAGTQDRAEHVAGFHRRQLVGVAKQDQPGATGDRIDQLGHHRQIDHRGFVDHHHVHRQRIVGVVAEAR